MDWTDRHCRRFHRLLSRRALLYTEMVTAPAVIHGDRVRLLDHGAAEGPVALQLGGSEPAELREATPADIDIMLSGIRAATLQVIATATIAAYVGLGGLGRFLIDVLGSWRIGAKQEVDIVLLDQLCLISIKKSISFFNTFMITNFASSVIFYPKIRKVFEPTSRIVVIFTTYCSR